MYFWDVTPRLSDDRPIRDGVGAALYALTLATMWTAALSDPGVIPRPGYGVAAAADADAEAPPEKGALLASEPLEGWQAVVHEGTGDVSRGRAERLFSDSISRNIRVAAAAPPRPASSGGSASRPRRRRDPPALPDLRDAAGTTGTRRRTSRRGTSPCGAATSAARATF